MALLRPSAFAALLLATSVDAFSSVGVAPLHSSTALRSPICVQARPSLVAPQMAADTPKSRRKVLGTAAAFAAGVLSHRLSTPVEAAPYALPPLPYDYKSLEPSIDEATMKFHHDKHFNAYTTNLNAALGDKAGSTSIVDLQKDAIKAGPGIRNNGGGFYNHGLFFEEMSGTKSAPSAELTKAINDAFGSEDAMKEKFNAAGAGRFGSGWAWLCSDRDGKLTIVSTPNQDNPLMEGADGYGTIPFLGLDVWEHAYYLKYQNLRPAYIKEWWNVVNWAKVSDYYAKYASKGQPVVW